MEVYLIRHTTPEIAKGICYGQYDLDLATSFLSELKTIQQALPKQVFNYPCFSSPLQRCSLLAQQLFKTVRFDERLKELNFGHWEMRAWDDIPKAELDPWMHDFVNTPTPQGESYVDLHKRTTEFLEELRQQNLTNAVLVTHGGVMRSLWAHVHDIPLNKSFDLKLSYGSILKLQL